jgi:hypothetical protein
VARNDPLPFVLKYTRTYHPRLWEILHELKIDQLPIQFERERNFINIYRRHDTARSLSDEGFERVLKFTQHAFDMAIHFVDEGENAAMEDAEATPGGGRGARQRAQARRQACASLSCRRRKQSREWSFTMPVACMCAYITVDPTKRKPRRFRSRLSASDSGLLAR